MLLFWSRSGKLARSLFSFPLNGRDPTPLLTCFTLLSFSFFTWTNYFKSNSLSPFGFFGQKISQSNSSSLFSSEKNILSSTSILQKYSKTIPNSVLAVKSFQPRKNIPRPIFFLFQKTSLFFAYPIHYLASGV